DRHPAGWDVSSESVGDGPDILWMLQRMPGVEVDSLDADLSISQSTQRLRVKRVERRVKGKWVKVRGPVVAKAGKKLALRAVLGSNEQTLRRKVSMVVPKRYKGTSQPVWVRGGRVHRDAYDITSVAKLKAAFAK